MQNLRLLLDISAQADTQCCQLSVEKPIQHFSFVIGRS